MWLGWGWGETPFRQWEAQVLTGSEGQTTWSRPLTEAQVLDTGGTCRQVRGWAGDTWPQGGREGGEGLAWGQPWLPLCLSHPQPFRHQVLWPLPPTYHPCEELPRVLPPFSVATLCPASLPIPICSLLTVRLPWDSGSPSRPRSCLGAAHAQHPAPAPARRGCSLNACCLDCGTLGGWAQPVGSENGGSLLRGERTISAP